MNIQTIISNTKQPPLYAEGTAKMWTDEHISKQLLQVHLSDDVDLASRKMSTIEKTIDWILQQVDDKPLNILDLGCGPGLYAEKLTQKGHKVTGVDFSKNSIDYARSQAEIKGLNINYINSDYLKLTLEENSFDLVILIYTDFGVLTPDERKHLLNLISKFLKPDGVFIFDVLNDKNMEQKTTSKNWEAVEQGFWRDKPYLVLSDSFFYKKEKVMLYQHTVIENGNGVQVYRFWTHFFSHKVLKKELSVYPFQKISFYEDVLPKSDSWNGDNVTFCKTINAK